MKATALLFFSFITVVGLLSAFTLHPKSTFYVANQHNTVLDLGPEEAFNTMMDVLTHPRCTNCHPTDNVPKQGEDAHPHYFGISRETVQGDQRAVQCATCHQTENSVYSGVPGAPHWGLAPASMGWQGLSRAEIAKKLLDRTQNGDRDATELIHHMTEDPLVLWAWDPGIDVSGKARELPPVSKEDFKAAVEAWFTSGAVIPTE